MKRLYVLVCIAGLVAVSASSLFAGGIINKQNLSADYMRTLNRNAATDYADIAAFNPAGIMKMTDGAYVKADLMYFDKDYSNKVPDNFGEFDQNFPELDQDEPSLIPGAFAIYKQKKWAGFFAFTVPAGGGDLDYDKGSARTVVLADQIAAGFNQGLEAAFRTDLFNYNRIDKQSIDVRESSVLGFTLGGSYAINPMWSVAAGVRYATGDRRFEGKADISAENPAPLPVNQPFKSRLKIDQDANGWAGILGVNFAPNDKVNAAVTFISNTKLDYENDVKQDTELPDGTLLSEAIGFKDGSERRIDIPALLGFGISYKFLPQLKVDFNFTYYFQEAAKIDTYDSVDDGWDVGLSAEYTFSPQWKASLGYLHTEIGLDDDQQINEPEEPKLDANTFAGGLVWSPITALSITAGGAIVVYDDVNGKVETARGEKESVNYDKDVWNVSIGIQWKIF